MRTNINTAIAISNVFGFGQDRAVSLRNDSCAPAAQHLESRHASKRARSLAHALKRRWSTLWAMAGTGPMATYTCVAVTGPVRPTVRVSSPVVVLS